MEEMKRAHLDKRKQKAMAAPAVLRQNEDQLVKSPGANAAGPLSPSAASSPVQLSRQITFAHASSSAAASPRASGNFGGAASPSSPGGDSDDENAGAAVAVDTSDPHMSNLLAAKRTEQGRKHISQAERDMLEQGIAPVYDPVKHTNFGGGGGNGGVVSNGAGAGASSSSSFAASSGGVPSSHHNPHHLQSLIKLA